MARGGSIHFTVDGIGAVNGRKRTAEPPTRYAEGFPGSVPVSIRTPFDAKTRKRFPADRRAFSGNSGITAGSGTCGERFGSRRSRVELRPPRGLARLRLKSRRPDLRRIARDRNIGPGFFVPSPQRNQLCSRSALPADTLVELHLWRLCPAHAEEEVCGRPQQSTFGAIWRPSRKGPMTARVQ